MRSGSVMTLPAKPMLRPAAARARLQSWPFPCLLPALASGFMLWLCYFPLALGWFGWVALVPLLLLVRSESRTRNIYWSAFGGGIVFFVPAILWMTVADYRMVATWAALSLYCSLYFPLAILLIRRLDRSTGWPLIVSVPVVWSALEFVRSFLLTGFAWYYLGHTQHRFLGIIQIADLGGVYAVSFLVAMVNAWLVECLLRIPEVRAVFRLADPQPGKSYRFERWPIPVAQGLVVAGLLGATLIYGGWRLEQNDFRPGPRLALLQGNLDQRIRNDASSDQPIEDTLFKIASHYAGLCEIAMHSQADLIVWPETSYPRFWAEASPKLSVAKMPDTFRNYVVFIRDNLNGLKKFGATNHLLGLNAFTLDENLVEKRWNSALLVKKNGEVDGRYDKIHRVPFGEYVPFLDWLPLMKVFAPYDYDYSISIGEELTRFSLKSKNGNFTFGVLICYEDTDPFLARQYGRQHPNGPPVDFLINISNDGWFDGSSEHEEHLAVSRFRAIETRRALCRAVNMGISAVIDPNGRVRHAEGIGLNKNGTLWSMSDDRELRELSVGEWAKFKKAPGVVAATVPIDDRVSVYAHVGDAFAGGCWAVIAGGIAWSWRRRATLKQD
ncbi:MAG: apolipoprotein N-acyltransferase [Planctomycetes bacterium]|nr:apolipoprotein N-acyltransferase [Planctomycetota bacterium]